MKEEVHGNLERMFILGFSLEAWADSKFSDRVAWTAVVYTVHNLLFFSRLQPLNPARPTAS
eukprot:75303-Pelagomonas_calceolata.AAC.3